MDWMQIALFIMKIAPAIIALIKQVQDGFPNASGPQKREVVVNTVMTAVKASPESAAAAKNVDLASIIGGIVDANVAALKSAKTPGFTWPTVAVKK